MIIFDIHAEYKSAFPNANFIDVSNLKLPYWLLNSEEIEEVLLDTGERDNYNQSSIFRRLVTENKKKNNPNHTKVFFDSPLFFDINEVQNALFNIKNETKNYKSNNRYMIVDPSYSCKDDGSTTADSGIEMSEDERIAKYFEKELQFHTPKNQNISRVT